MLADFMRKRKGRGRGKDFWGTPGQRLNILPHLEQTRENIERHQNRYQIFKLSLSWEGAQTS